jgi:hypothetical protein
MRVAVDQAADPPTKRGGGKRTVNVREVVNGVTYALNSGRQVALHPQKPAAARHLERLLLLVGLGRHGPSRALREMPRTSRTRGQSNGLRDRQPEREMRKRGAPASTHTALMQAN